MHVCQPPPSSPFTLPSSPYLNYFQTFQSTCKHTHTQLTKKKIPVLCLQAFLLILKSGKGVTVCVCMCVTAHILFVYTYFICVSLYTWTFVCFSAFVRTYERGIYKKSNSCFLINIFYFFPLLNHHQSQKRKENEYF